MKIINRPEEAVNIYSDRMFANGIVHLSQQ